MRSNFSCGRVESGLIAASISVIGAPQVYPYVESSDQSTNSREKKGRRLTIDVAFPAPACFLTLSTMFCSMLLTSEGSGKSEITTYQ